MGRLLLLSLTIFLLRLVSILCRSIRRKWGYAITTLNEIINSSTTQSGFQLYRIKIVKITKYHGTILYN